MYMEGSVPSLQITQSTSSELITLACNKLLTTGFPLENEAAYLGPGSKDVDF